MSEYRLSWIILDFIRLTIQIVVVIRLKKHLVVFFPSVLDFRTEASYARFLIANTSAASQTSSGSRSPTTGLQTPSLVLERERLTFAIALTMPWCVDFNTPLSPEIVDKLHERFPSILSNWEG